MTGARRGGWATELIHGVEDLLYPASHALMLSTNRFDPDLERRCLEQLAHRGVDGIPLVFTCPSAARAAVERLLEAERGERCL